jgi:hypothetical protein
VGGKKEERREKWEEGGGMKEGDGMEFDGSKTTFSLFKPFASFIRVIGGGC